MSFEGYYQIVCSNGHEGECGCYYNPVFEPKELDPSGEGFPSPYGEERLWKCPVCGELAAWWNLVDVTNGCYCECNPDCEDRTEGCEYCDHGRIDGYVDLEEVTPTETCTCEKCGNTHIAKQQTVKIPEERGHRVNR